MRVPVDIDLPPILNLYHATTVTGFSGLVDDDFLTLKNIKAKNLDFHSHG